jgi:magnesium-transporting ATPase (P-type)
VSSDPIQLTVESSREAAPPTLEPAQEWACDIAALARHLDVDLLRGLSAAEAARRLSQQGPNALPETPPRSLSAVLLSQLKSPLVLLLILAAAIASLLGELADAIVIVVVIAINSAIGAAQEGRAERSLEALKRLVARTARVLRDGAEGAIDAATLVRGDVVILAAGDAVPADARVLEAVSLQVDESALTGESRAVEKGVAAVAADAALADRANVLHAGTSILSGRARAVVLATGPATEVGHIAAMASSAPEMKTPLMRRVERFGRQLLIAAGLLFVLVAGVGVARGLELAEIAMVALSQVVGMVPEGLPVATTIALAVGVQRMVKRRAIVRRLGAVEALGSVTVICSDKTGTLTKNEMTVKSVVLGSGAVFEVSGAGYEPRGELTPTSARLEDGPRADLWELLECAILCNDAELTPPTPEDDTWRVVGDPTEGALVVLARKGGVDVTAARGAAPRMGELPFSSVEKRMATEHRGVVHIKGAPESVLALCGSVRDGGGSSELDAEARRQIATSIARMAARGLRVLAFARAEGAVSGGWAALEGRATLLGFVGEADPPRPEAAQAVAKCRTAGIRPLMITGDHEDTAVAIAKELGIMSDGGISVGGRQLAALSDAELDAQIGKVAVFARVEPADKLRIVEALQRRGEVVAMTGDGVNDAPALVRADVGVAMGKSGTDVAKQAAQVILTDDDFATIVAAVEEGRIVNANLRKVLLLLLSTSLAEVAVLTLAMALGFPPPFAAVQILWNNLVTEGVITVNLVLEPAEGDEMRRPPVPPNQPLITRDMLARIAWMTASIASVTLGWFAFRLQSGVPFGQVQSETFTLLAVCEWFNVLSCRSSSRTALSKELFANRYLLWGLLVGNLLQLAVIFAPPMNRLFHTQPLELSLVLAIGLVASVVLWAEELRKLVTRWRHRAEGAVLGAS